jgi:hypothetical protein
MQFELDDEETCAFLSLLTEAIEADPQSLVAAGEVRTRSTDEKTAPRVGI